MRLKSKLFWTENLHLVTLWAFSAAQPLYALLGEQAGFFSARKADRVDLVLFVIAFSVIFPLILVITKELIGLAGDKTRNAFHSLWTVLLLSLLSLPLLRQLAFLPDLGILAIALAIGIGGAVLYWRSESFGKLLTFLSPAILIFPIVFLLFSNVTPILLKKEPVLEGSAKASAKDLPPVVMVIWDELPVASLLDSNGEIDAERYPNFARFSNDSTWFKNTYSVGGSTLWAVPGILTGQFPGADSTRTPQEMETNLFTLFTGTHEMTNVMEKYTTLCPQEFCKRGRRRYVREFIKSLPDLAAIYLHLVSPPRLATFLPDISSNWEDFSWAREKRLSPPAAGQATSLQGLKAAAEKVSVSHEETADRDTSLHIDRPTPRKGKDKFPGHQWGLFEKFLGRIPASRSGHKPTFNFLHIVFPHVPYNYMPSGKYYRVGPYKYFTTWHNEREIYFDLQRHLLQLGATDTMMGKLMDRLEQQALYENALIIVLADHGANWTSPGDERRKLGEKNHRDLIRVPMWIKMPHQKEGRIIDKPVRTVDLLPTIADLLDLELPGKPGAVDGHSIFSPEYPEFRTVRVVGNGGKEIFDFPVERNPRTPSLERRLAWFGSGSLEKLFTYGPQIISGQPLANFRIEPSLQWSYRLGEPENYETIDLAESFVPTLVEGKVFSKTAILPENLVIAVNGTIWNSYPLMIPESDGVVFGGMVPESSLVSGKNDIRIFEMRDSETLIEISRQK